MARSKKLGVGKVYVSNVYSILLSPKDHTTLAGLIPTLQGELETYLLAFSREHDFQMATRPIVRFYPAPDLKLGRFEVIGDMLSIAEIEKELGYVPGVTPEPPASPEQDPVAPRVAVRDDRAFIPEVDLPELTPEPAPVAAPGFSDSDLDIEPTVGTPGFDDLRPPSTPAVRPTPRLRHDFKLPDITDDDRLATEALRSKSIPVPLPTAAVAPTPRPETKIYLTMENFGPLSLKGKRRVTIGRQDDNDLVIADVNASRHHAHLEQEGAGWAVVDQGATNGTLLNGERVTRARLRDDDVVTIGVTKITYHEKAPRL